MNSYEEAVRLLPRKAAAALGGGFECAEEFRLRTGISAAALIEGRELPFGEPLTTDDLASVVEQATHASVHAFSHEISRGFISCLGGVRLGLCGTAVMQGNRIIGLRDISSCAVRIPHEVFGCGGDALNEVLRRERDNVLIISPPGGGKTTFARECIRAVSGTGKRVGVCDERGELAAMYGGRPRFDIGGSADVISNAPKAEAALMLLRSMNPDVLVMDEISSPEDCGAVRISAGCGVRIIATAHAAAVSELRLRPVYRRLLSQGLFSLVVVIEKHGGEREYRTEEIR